MMTNKTNKLDIDEKLIAKIWKNRDFKGSEFHSIDGKGIEVLSVGVENEDEGADFKNSQIRIEDKIISGNVEIHVRSSDWMTHKHQLDPKYNSVILHVVMWHDTKTLMTKKHNSERIPIIELCDQLNADVIDIWQKYKSENLTQPNPYQQYRMMDRERLARLLDKLGDLRFEDKVKRFEDRLSTKPFERLIYDGLFEAAGYSKNRTPFLKLTKIIDPVYFNTLALGREELAATLLGCAGLLPSQNPNPPELKGEALKISTRFQKIWDLKRQQSKLDTIPRESWRLLKIRPNNSPIRRIIAISEILTSHKDKLFLRFLESVNSDCNGESQKNIKNLRAILMPKASYFWACHFDFDRATKRRTNLLIGQNRADDMIVNVVLPLLYLYANLNSDRWLQNRVNKLYFIYPRLQDNFITRRLETMIFEGKMEAKLIVNSARRQQGLLQIYSQVKISSF